MNNFKRKDTEQQAHGFKFEDYIIYKYGLIKDKNRTSPWDAHTSKGIPVSIKNSGRGSSDIVFGDIFRQARMKEDRFILIIGFWEESWQNLTDMYIIPIMAKDWTSMFNLDAVNHYENMLKISHRAENIDNQDLWENLRDQGKVIEESSGTIMQGRCRWSPEKSKKTGLRGHRIQCAINRNDFDNHFIKSGKYNLRYRDLRPLRDEYIMFVERTTETTKTTYTKITEDTKYGKKITETKVTETKVTETKITETIEADKALQAHLRMMEILKKKGEVNRRRSEWK